MEEFESEGRVFEGFENEGSFKRGEGDGEGLEIVGEVGEGVGEGGGGGGGEEDLGGFADEVTAGEIVAERVGGEGWWWGYFGGEGTAGRGSGGDFCGVFCGEVAAEMVVVWFHWRNLKAE